VRDGLQTVDPAVSRVKFEREVGQYGELAKEYRARGWLLARAEFPHVVVAMVARQLNPPAVVCGVKFDFTDYDARPPSVRLVDPFTEEPYTAAALPTVLKRAVAQDAVLPPGFPLPPGAQARMMAEQALMQAYGPEDIPFLCLPGVREYHDHPGHSGDAWELHRPVGAGRLVRILEVIDAYGLRPINGYNVALVPQITGFTQNQVPE
jgi:hypothetical protein